MYKIKLSELQKGISGIYLLEYPNNKIYIGQSIDIKRRMYEHNNIKENSRRKENGTCAVCDLAIIKYGRINEITILEECSQKDLNDRERFWIAYYNSLDRNIGYNLAKGGQNNRITFLTENEILSIRQERQAGNRKKDVYEKYKDKISFGGFEKIWLGTTRPDIGKELLGCFKNKTRQEYSHEANDGTNNGRAKFTKEQVLEIRNYGENKPENISWRAYYKQIADKYLVSINTISRIIRLKSYKNI